MNVSSNNLVSPEQTGANLNRTVGFWALTIYGIGDILGAGIYALVGEIVIQAGLWAPFSFLIAMTAAGLTGLTYVELVTRYPRSGGEATFCLEAFDRPWLAFLIGWLVFCSGLVSMATVTHAFGNYMHAMWPFLAQELIWILFLSAISFINFWGIRQSSLANIVFTLVESSGLMLVIFGGLLFLKANGVPEQVASQPIATANLGVLSAAALAFFAYIGFEDMINIAEEVRAPEKTYPWAIITAVIVCGVIYFMVSAISVLVLPVADLGNAKAPLVEVVRRTVPTVPPFLFTIIALIAVANTGLLNCIMASRLIFGMSRHNLLPKWLGKVHAKTQTPHYAVLTILGVGIIIVFSGTLTQLAETTSLLLLLVFATINAAAIRIRWRAHSHDDHFRMPIIIPFLALGICLGLGVFISRAGSQTVALIILVGLLLMFLMRGFRGTSISESA